MKFTSIVVLTIQLAMTKGHCAKIVSHSYQLQPFLGAVYFQPETCNFRGEQVEIWNLLCGTDAGLELQCDINIPETLACSYSSLTVFVNGVGKTFCGKTSAYFNKIPNSVVVMYRKRIQWYLPVLDPFYCKADSHTTSMLTPVSYTPPPINYYLPLIDDSTSGISPGRMLTKCPCGWANSRTKNTLIAGRLVGGEEYQVNEYPFVVQLFDSLLKHPFCAGTIITPIHVITAGHCALQYWRKPQHLGVGAGTYDNSRSSPSSLQLNTARNIIIHEEFRIKNNGLQHDIAILVLVMPFHINMAVGPACMPFPHWDLTGQRVRILGWGAKSLTSNMTSRPQKVDMMVVDHLSCKNRWRSTFISSSHLCTQWHNKSTCHGDSGGPVVWLDHETNRYTLVGVVSYGPNCDDGSPSIQTDVAAHLPWIFRWVERKRPNIDFLGFGTN